MSNANQETIEDIVADIRAQNQGLPEDSYALSPLVCDLLSFADRIEAAHQREVGELCGERNGILNANASLAADNDRLRKEVEELRECLEQAYGDKIGTYTMKGNEVERWRKALQDEGGEK